MFNINDAYKLINTFVPPVELFVSEMPHEF